MKAQEKPRSANSGGRILLAVRFATLNQEALNVLESALDRSVSAKTFSILTFRPDWSAAQPLAALLAAHEIEVFDESNLLAIDDTAVYFETESRLPEQQGVDRDQVGLKVSLRPKRTDDGKVQVTVNSTVVMPRETGGEHRRELTRRSQCVVELADGQSFWIRGLVEPAQSSDFLKRLSPARTVPSDGMLELAVLVTPTFTDRSGTPLNTSADD